MFKKVIRILLRIKLVIKYPLILAFITSIIIIASNFIWINNLHHLHMELSPTLAHTPKTKQKLQKQLSKKQRTDLSRDASFLTQQGHEKLARGESEEALQIWKDAEKLYQQSGDEIGEIGVIGSKINQSIALQELGLYRRSCKTLVLAFESDTKICNPSNQLENSENSYELDNLIKLIKEDKYEDKSIVITGLQSLGDILRMVGNLNESKLTLTETLDIAKNLNLPSSISDIRLSLGNTQQVLFYREKDLYNIFVSSNESDKDEKIKYAKKTLIKAREAIATFQQNIYDSNSEVHKIKSEINNLRLSVDLLNSENLLKKLSSDTDTQKRKQWEKQWKDLKISKDKLVFKLIEKEPKFYLFSPIQEIYARLNLVNILIKEIDENDSIKEVAKKYAQSALNKAYELHNKRAEAYALGALGCIYFHDNQLALSKKYTEQASIVAQSIVAPDITYQLLRQLGKICEKLNDSDKAIMAYDAAVKNLDIVRKDLLSLSPDIRFSFRENVIPVYQEFIEILLRNPNDNQKLNKVFEVNSSLQEAKLQNFTQCDQIYLELPEELDLENNVQNLAGIIHIIRLDDVEKLAVIAKSPKQPNKPICLKVYEKEKLEQFDGDINVLYSIIYEDHEFLKGRNDANFEDSINEIPFFQYSKKIYNFLFSGLESYLPKKGTLLFTIDNDFQYIPLSILHDGERYLVDKYSIVMTLSGKIPNSKPLSKNNLRVLFSGLTEEFPIFTSKEVTHLNLTWDKLPGVNTELKKVKDYANAIKELLDEKFTRKTFQNKLLSSYFPIVHVATHGHFSSNPDKTFIAASDDLIKLSEIERLMNLRNEKTDSSINLLILSACETAKSDKRATLGIAGVATQAGAGSTLATLWNVQDDSTAKLIGEFYKNLSSTETINKAESLRQAQRSLIHSEEYSHPYYWGAFVFAGNWL